jgi:hypothetical protein
VTWAALDDRCSELTFRAAAALTQCSPQDWRAIGWVAASSGRQGWDAWYNVHTGEGRLRKQRG